MSVYYWLLAFFFGLMRAFNCVIVPLIALGYSFGFNLFVVIFVVICLRQLFSARRLVAGPD